ncbi:hypothetical protein AGOR_G00048440 [Albula goreensis]|uniref:RAMA domain-containing protein n=1 Tax=Albula goreensis TaxID=1534307 RepID=A0A8T3E066_9TELE|nr:hypothetical protein AGOR_G00048440 [Albula goreensis]
MSLAFRQKRLLNILQKQNALKLSFQTQRSRPTTQQISTQCPPVGENSPTTDYLSSVSTGPDGKTGLEAPSDCHGGASEETCSSQSTSSHGDENLLDSSDSTHITLDIESPAGPTSTKTSGHQPLLLSSSPRAASSEKEKQRSEVTGTTVAASCNPQTCFLKDCSTAQLQFLSNLTDNHQIIQMPQAMPTVVPISAGNIPPSSWSAYQPMSSVQTLSRITINSGKLNTEKRLPGTKKVYNQTGEDFQGSVSRQNVHVITKIQSNMSGTCSTEHRECGTAHCVPHVTSSGTAFTVDSHSKTKASANDCLSPHEESVGDSRQLVSLIQHGVIKPGHNVLQLTLKGFTHRASLEPDGSIIDTKGQHFLSPAQWIVSFLGPNIPVSSTFAWKKVKYRSKSLSAYSVSSEATALQQASGAGGTPAEEPRRQGPSPAI